MNHFSSLSAAGLLSAHIKQDVSLIFIRDTKTFEIPKKFHTYLSIFIAFLGFFSASPGSSYADEQKYFIVTAYYSPLPGQDFYLRGDYNSEIALNGNGINGASGKPVFAGMLAAPKTYSFGTRIDLEGLGIGEVEDRGGAIVTAGTNGQNYDRIDVWMGSGDAGLKRALVWGRRKVLGTIITDTSKPLLSFTDIDSGKINLSDIAKATNTPTTGFPPTDVMDMFADLGYTTDGRSTEAMILDFQLDHNIISSPNDTGAGNYGPLTKAKLLAEHAQYVSLRDAEMKKIEDDKKALIAQNIEWTSTYKVVNEKVLSFGSPKKGEKSSQIKNLQTVLKNTGYMKISGNGTMSLPTVQAIKNLQKEYGLTASGTLDENTKQALIEVMMDKRAL